MSVTLRATTPEDEKFLLSVYSSTRAEELALAPWDDKQKLAFVEMQFKAQATHYLNKYPNADHQVILRSDVPVGRLYVDRTGPEICILDIAVLPEFRRAGTATIILKEIMDNAQRAGKRIHIYVEVYNPSLAFFGRLGFAKIAEDGVNWLLEWRPVS